MQLLFNNIIKIQYNRVFVNNFLLTDVNVYFLT